MFFCARCGSALQSFTNPSKCVCPYCGWVTEIKRLKDGSLEFDVYEPYSRLMQVENAKKQLEAYWG